MKNKIEKEVMKEIKRVPNGIYSTENLRQAIKLTQQKTKEKAREEIEELFDFDHTKKFKLSLDRDKCKFCKLKDKILGGVLE